MTFLFKVLVSLFSLSFRTCDLDKNSCDSLVLESFQICNVCLDVGVR